jgi:hypothetical protein
VGQRFGKGLHFEKYITKKTMLSKPESPFDNGFLPVEQVPLDGEIGKVIGFFLRV